MANMVKSGKNPSLVHPDFRAESLRNKYEVNNLNSMNINVKIRKTKTNVLQMI